MIHMWLNAAVFVCRLIGLIDTSNEFLGNQMKKKNSEKSRRCRRLGAVCTFAGQRSFWERSAHQPRMGGEGTHEKKS